MKDKLLVVFVKNVILGKAKTRLAASVGKYEAFKVYKRLVEITEIETNKIEDIDVHIYFSDKIIESKWPDKKKFVQQGRDLGERMKNAFENGFAEGYKKIVGIGSDLPNITAEIIEAGLSELEAPDAVFGPAEDGGYYLLGMKKVHPEIFDNKAWSTEGLLNQTLKELEDSGISYKKIQTLNDIDNIEDLANSSLAEEFSYLL